VVIYAVVVKVLERVSSWPEIIADLDSLTETEIEYDAEPCPVPLSLTVTTPSSRTPAFNHFWIRRIMRRGALGRGCPGSGVQQRISS
jgi:hypothetical protein